MAFVRSTFFAPAKCGCLAAASIALLAAPAHASVPLPAASSYDILAISDYNDGVYLVGDPRQVNINLSSSVAPSQSQPGGTGTVITSGLNGGSSFNYNNNGFSIGGIDYYFELDSVYSEQVPVDFIGNLTSSASGK